jgi:chromosome segregation ATPase
MNLFDKLIHALKSAVNDVVSEDVRTTPANKSDATLQLIEKAEAKIDILKADLARAEKAGQADLAGRLKSEIEALQGTLNKTRQRIGKLERREAAVESMERAQKTRREQRKVDREASDGLKQQEEAAAQREDVAAARDELDNTRIADALKRAPGDAQTKK